MLLYQTYATDHSIDFGGELLADQELISYNLKHITDNSTSYCQDDSNSLELNYLETPNLDVIRTAYSFLQDWVEPNFGEIHLNRFDSYSPLPSSLASSATLLNCKIVKVKLTKSTDNKVITTLYIHYDTLEPFDIE